MAVSILQSPNIPFDQAYGPNPVTLTGIPVDPGTGVLAAQKYVLQIFRNGTKIADLRQSPNGEAKAIFDIQNTLQNFVAPSPSTIEETGYAGLDLATATNESTPYSFAAGYENNGVVTIEVTTSQSFLDFGGTKEYYDVPYSAARFIPIITTNAPGCTNVLKRADVFSDVNTFRLGSEITDGKPPWLTATTKVFERNVTPDDMTTLSYFNGVSGTGPASAAGIEAFTFWQYNGNTLLSTDTIFNNQANGGGPNATTGQGTTPSYPFRGITVGTGPINFTDFNGTNVTHYYVAVNAFTPSSCPGVTTNLTDDSIFDVFRLNLISPLCNDYPEFQFSWLNSYGFRDYFSFSKRKEKSVAINRNTFLKEAADYNGSSYTVGIQDRGTTVYSQTLMERFSAFTDYLTDKEAKYLEGLFTSADVRVRFNDLTIPQRYEFVPVALLSTSYTEKTYRKDRLFQYNIDFKLAHNIKSQRG
tara:strand:+ start:1210 stop:2625 length:1416 start_codon:yes stop_codon:yes gene_type:complete